MASRTKFGLLVLVILLIGSGVSRVVGGKDSPPLIAPQLHLSGTFNFQFESVALRKIVQKDLEGQNGNFAVYIEGLGESNKELYTFNELQPFPAASLYKLVLVAAALDRVEKGQMHLGDEITSTKSHLTEVLGSEDFGYEDSPEAIKYTLEESLARIGAISDNFAAIMLTEKLRVNAVRDPLTVMAEDLGMRNTKFGDIPITTAEDIAFFFKKLYRGGIVSAQSSEQIRSLLNSSKINNRIPAKLPKGIKVVHKTGELPRLRHDAGIVYLEKLPYVVVLLSKDLKYEDDGVDLLAKISKDIFDYFSQKR